MNREKYLVRVVRPVFQAAYLEVEGRDENEACLAAYQAAHHLPEERWAGRFNSDDYSFDIHCVHSFQTAEGHDFSLLDFPNYSILTTNQNPFIVSQGYEIWMNYQHPLSVAGQLSQWISQMEITRSGCYEEAMEDLEEKLKQWKGTDQKVVPLVPPEHLRQNIEYVESLLEVLHLLNDVD